MQTAITTVLQTYSYIKKNSFQPQANIVRDENGNLLALSPQYFARVNQLHHLLNIHGFNPLALESDI